MKKRGGIIQKMVGGILLGAAVICTIPTVVYGTAYAWYGYADTPGTNIKTGVQVKKTNSSVFVNYNSGSSSYVGISVFGYNGSYYVDRTFGSGYRAYPGSNLWVEVKNMIYEDYGQCNSYAQMTTITSGNHNGRWEPDR